MTGADAALSADVITYRRLTRDDFRALHPPPKVGENAQKMGAVTCAAIKSRSGAQMAMVPRGEEMEVSARGLVFEALMDRRCSWWNGDRQIYTDAYVLEHEQIHWALFEVEARRLTRRAPAEVVVGRRDTDPDVLADRLERRVDLLVDEAAEAVIERSLRFDEDTSFQEEPGLQRRWLEKVEAELRGQPR